VILRDVFLALTSGATLAIPPEQAALDPREVVRWLAEEQITTIHVVPSLARLWLSETTRPTPLPALRRVFFAGEPLQDVLVDNWRRTFSSTCDVINLYGPTETTLAKCFFRVAFPSRTRNPTGRPDASADAGAGPEQGSTFVRSR